jgi:hypothetical protein
MTTKTTAKKTTTTTKIPELPAHPFAFEVFDLVSKQRSAAKKVEVLQKYNHPSLRAILIWNFDESVISMLPEGEVPYGDPTEQTVYKGGNLSTKITSEIRDMYDKGSLSVQDEKQGRTTIEREYTKFYHFIKGGNDGLKSLRRETMFINILTGLHPLEAEILVLVKDKKLSDRYKITQAVVAKAFPQIKWGGRS